jgi:hypothetical protein
MRYAYPLSTAAAERRKKKEGPVCRPAPLPAVAASVAGLPGECPRAAKCCMDIQPLEGVRPMELPGIPTARPGTSVCLAPALSRLSWSCFLAAESVGVMIKIPVQPLR